MLLFQTNPSFQMLLSIRKLYLTFNLLKYSKFTPNVREEKESSFHDCSESNIMQYGITTFVMSSFDSVSIFIFLLLLPMPLLISSFCIILHNAQMKRCDLIKKVWGKNQ